MNINDSPKAYGKLGTIFVSIGVIALIAGLISYLIIDNIFSGYIQTQALITDITESNTHISYTADGQDFCARLSEYNSSWRIGDMLTVYYNPNNPAKVISGMIRWLIPLILGFNGCVFFVAGYFLFIRVNRKRRKLMRYGTPLTAEITDVQVNYNLRVNRRHPMRVKCRHTAPDGKEHIFVCNVWEPLDESVIGKTITVYVSGNNMKSFYVDASSLELPDNVVYHEA